MLEAVSEALKKLKNAKGGDVSKINKSYIVSILFAAYRINIVPEKIKKLPVVSSLAEKIENDSGVLNKLEQGEVGGAPGGARGTTGSKCVGGGDDGMHADLVSSTTAS